LGFDGAWKGDVTALVACTLDGRLEVVAMWERPRGDDEWRVPIQQVEETIKETCKHYDVIEIVCDPYRWERSLEILEEEGLPMTEFPQNPQRMVPACQKFYDAVIDKQVRHDGDARLERHLNNCEVKIDHRGARIVKDNKSSSRHIDLAVAAVMAYDRATQNEPGEPLIQWR
jgi:phage terminase large subunit-like protein